MLIIFTNPATPWFLEVSIASYRLSGFVSRNYMQGLNLAEASFGERFSFESAVTPTAAFSNT